MFYILNFSYLVTIFKVRIPEKPTSPTIFDIKDFFAKLSTAQKGLLEEVGVVLKLILVMPCYKCHVRMFIQFFA